ncbi:FAD-dependent oxidoreductase [Neomoorella glycerini]|uniref:FAD-dependent oxidoreductase n=1 Tax=Neomoorella glycerini TaxID=55779 RepID=UPI0012E29A47|nr:FAD-dependent oxidoreductase [Moorella glycerini]
MFSPTIITDVAIIGGGLAGMYAALAAKKRGCKVIIICKERVGRSGASLIAQTVHRVAYSTELDLDRY